MKKALVILWAFLASCSITDPHYLNLSETRKKELDIQRIDPTEHFGKSEPVGVYSINSNELFSLLSNSVVKYKIVLFFTNWCPNSAESIPVLLDALKNKEELEIYMISPDDWIRKPSYLGYQRKYNLNQNIYLLDVYSYGEKRNPHYRMEKFISEICSDCKEIMGFPSFLIFNRENNIIFKQTGNIEPSRMDTILRIINAHDKS